MHFDRVDGHHPIRAHHQGWIRPNTYEECAVQIVGLTRVRYGSGFEHIPSDHHVFEFERRDGGVLIRCKTPNRPDDEFVVPGHDVVDWVQSYSRAIWDHHFEPRDRHAEDALDTERHRIIEMVGERPPFLADIPTKPERKRLHVIEEVKALLFLIFVLPLYIFGPILLVAAPFAAGAFIYQKFSAPEDSRAHWETSDEIVQRMRQQPHGKLPAVVPRR